MKNKKLEQRKSGRRSRLSFACLESRQMLAGDFLPAIMVSGNRVPPVEQVHVVQCDLADQVNSNEVQREQTSEKKIVCPAVLNDRVLNPVTLNNFSSDTPTTFSSVSGLSAGGYQIDPGSPRLVEVIDPVERPNDVVDSPATLDVRNSETGNPETHTNRQFKEGLVEDLRDGQRSAIREVGLAPISMTESTEISSTSVAASLQPIVPAHDYFVNQRDASGTIAKPSLFRSGLIDRYQTFALASDSSSTASKAVAQYDALDRVIAQSVSSEGVVSAQSESFTSVEVVVGARGNGTRLWLTTETGRSAVDSATGVATTGSESYVNSESGSASWLARAYDRSLRIHGILPYGDTLAVPDLQEQQQANATSKSLLPADERVIDEQAKLSTTQSTLLFALLASSLKRRKVDDDAKVLRRRKRY